MDENREKNWYDDEITQAILHKKYLHENENTFDDLVNRVSSIYSEDIREDVKNALYNADLCPAGRTLYAAGYKGQKKLTGSNCFVLQNVGDTLEEINQLDYEVSRIGSMGGGIGFAVDNIRPKGSKINNAARVSDGVAFVMRKLNNTGQIVGQAGRGLAIMCGIRCNHPDIYEILNMKNNGERLESMNISVKFTDDFMQAVEQNKEYELYFKVESTGEEIRKIINAREFFIEFCKTNKDWADPGCIFIDRVRSYNLISGYSEYKIDICNPCAEYFGNDGNSCLLQSINLYNMVDNKFEDNASINYTKLEHLVRLSIRMMNQTQDYGYDMLPLDKNRKNVDDWRSIGLGIMGLADMLVALGVKYGSDESRNIATKIADTIQLTALDESCNEAQRFGTFGKYDWEKQKESPIIKALLLSDKGKKIYDKIEKYGLRNSSLISYAPTGSIALLLGKISSGIEPLFKLRYNRSSHQQENSGKTFYVYSRSIEDLLIYHNLPLDMPIEDIKKKFPFVVESHDISWKDRVLFQSALQEYVDNAISSTVNLPETTTVDDIFNMYLFAWKQKLKGVTCYVNHCKRGDILGVDIKSSHESVIYDSIEPISRRGVKEVNGTTYKMTTACSKLFITINKTSNGDLFEVFSNITGGCAANIGSICRLTSAALRSGMKVQKIIEELRAIACPACQALRRRGEKDIELSCGNAIAKALEMSYNKEIKEETINGLEECPSCHKQTLKPEGRCKTCQNCGWSKCS